MNFALASSLLRGKWAIDPFFALNSLSLVSDILEGRVEVDRKVQPISSLFKIAASRANAGTRSSGSSMDRWVAVTRIEGPVMKSDMECGPAGMETIGNTLRMMDNDPKVAGHLIIFDTPGGTVDGTEVFGDVIANLTKPTLGYVSGLCASAGLWLISNTNEVWASTELDEIGSVGVLLSFADIQGALEKNGVKFHTIVSTLSPDKVKMWEDLRAGKYEEYRERFLDPIAEKFQSVVRANFPNVTDDHLTGKVFHARDLINIIVDNIGTIDKAIARVAEMADEHEAQNNQTILTSNNTKSTMKNAPKLMALLAITELVAEEGFSSLSEDQILAIEAALPDADAVEAQQTTLNNNIAQLEQQLEQTSTALTASQSLADEREQRIALLETELTELRAGPADVTGAAVTKADTDASQTSATVTRDGMSIEEKMEKVSQAYGF